MHLENSQLLSVHPLLARSDWANINISNTIQTATKLSGTLQSPQSSPVTVAIAPRSRTDWWCTRSLSAPSRRVINWTGSGLIIKLRRCSKDNSANQSFICQNQIYFNCPSVVADAAQQLVHEIHGTMRITGDLSAGNHDINISYSFRIKDLW